MCLFFFNAYLENRKIPRNLMDMNIASDYSKLSNMLNLCRGEEKTNIIEKTIVGEGIITKITQQFNPAIEFTEQELISMLFYLGYLTIVAEKADYPVLKVPNKAMKEIYSDYF